MTYHRALLAIALVITLAFGPGCASSQRTEKPEPPRLKAWEDFKTIADGGVFLGGQPSEEALDQFASEGGRLVINLRTDQEMAYFPYYDRSVASRGMSYVRIPTKGSELGLATDTALTDALERAAGSPVMLHCASGGRASYAWAMHLMSAQGMSPEDAIAWLTELRESEVSEKGQALITDFAEAHAEAQASPGSAAQGSQH